MTATTKPRNRPDQKRPAPIRFFSMETLGFSDSKSTWSDSPLAIPMQLQTEPPERLPTEPAPRPPEPDLLADWVPEDVEPRLSGSNTRWSVAVILILLIGAALGFGVWMFVRPAPAGQPQTQMLDAEVTQLQTSLPALQELNDALLGDPNGLQEMDVTEVESAARQLFEASGELPQDATQTRYLATGAAGSALDGVRLAGDARVYLLAVTPILTAPALETDPAVIALDDAARSFGDWQIWFDQVRTALPDGVLSDVTEQLDVLSGDLGSFLSDYVDALREDDAGAAAGVLRDLSSRLDQIHQSLAEAVNGTQQLVTQRINETETALARLQG